MEVRNHFLGFDHPQVKSFTRTSYGWNFAVQTSQEGRIQIVRYWTNGHTNDNFQFSPWMNEDSPTSWEECDRLMH